MSDAKDLVFGACQTCLRPICQCPAKHTPPPDAQAMTLKDYAYRVNSIANRNYENIDELLKLLTEVYAHDAAQRETIRRLEEKIEHISKLATPAEHVLEHNKTLQARLTASEAALRDCLALARRRQRTDMAEDWSHIIRFCDQAGIKPDGTLRQGPLTPGE